MNQLSKIDKENEYKLKLESLTPNQLKLLEAQVLGYGKLPPTKEFVTSEYYLGGTVNLYPYWLEFLQKLFPDEITQTDNILALIAGLGTGKSLISQVIAAYTLCRLQHMRNLAYFGINDLSKPIKFVFMHMSADQANSEFIEPLRDKIKRSPYFQTGVPYKYKYSFIADALRIHKGLGGNVLFYVMSEINFYPNPDKAKKRLNIALNRYLSRFKKGLGYIGMIIMDSSPTDDSAVVDNFIKSTPYNVCVCREPQWVIKKGLGMFSDTYFQVYIGDSIRSPFIIDEDHPLEPDMDPDNVLDVPDDLREPFESNIELALQDQGGISTKTTGTYVKYPEKLKVAFCLPHEVPDVFSVKFYDNDDQIFDYIEHAVRKYVPVERRIYIGLDMGIKKDKCGIAIGYYDGEFIDDESLKIYKPTFSVPILFTLSRKKGEETAISKILKFIIKMTTLFEVSGVLMDTYESKALEQDLKLEKIRAWYISTDRTPVPTDYVKNAIYEGRVKAANSKLLYDEWRKLKRDRKGKINHTSTSTKDLTDAFVRCVYGMFMDIKHAAKFSKAYQMQINQKLMNDMYKPSETQEALSNKLNSLINDNSMSNDSEIDEGW